MGAVFTYKQIKEGLIPKLAGFREVTDYVRRGLMENWAVVSATLCGSVAWNACTIRSDVDCVVIYSEQFYEHTIRMLQQMTMAAIDINIPLQLIPIAADVAKSRVHPIGLSFAEHIALAEKRGGHIKGNPISAFLKLDHIDRDEEMRGYLRQKLTKLELALTCINTLSEEDVCTALEKALGVAIRIARKMLWYCKITSTDGTDSAAWVRNVYPTIANTAEFELFNRICSIDTEYTTEAMRHIEGYTGYPNQNLYDDLLKKMNSVVWDACEFTKLIAMRFA